jgi:hypothetical protein
VDNAGKIRIFKPATWPGTRFDWVFAILATILVVAGYSDAWIDRNVAPEPWLHAPSQAAWLLVTCFLAGTALVRWLSQRRLDAIIPSGYELSAAGCIVFAAGILISIWWSEAFGTEIVGVPAIFRPPNLIQITGGVLIVTGPLRASIGRGELVAGPTALISATMVFAAITFFSQFNHPYVNDWAAHAIGGYPYNPKPVEIYIDQELGALGLLMQSAIVCGAVLLLLRQVRLPIGSVTLMLTFTGVLLCAQYGRYQYVPVAAVVGVLSDVLLLWARPRSDRIFQLRVFAAGTGALLPAVYLVAVQLQNGEIAFHSTDVVYGSVVICGLVGWLMSYLTFPEREVAKAAAVLWPPLEQDSNPAAPDITVERLEHALKVFGNLRDLGESPLVNLRCLPAHNASSLRQVMEDAISSLRASPAQIDAQAGEILQLYYVRRIGGHYAVERRVGLSRAAYFNRRSYGVRRLVDRLKELEEPTATA